MAAQHECLVTVELIQTITFNCRGKIHSLRGFANFYRSRRFMNIIDVIKRGFLCGFICVEDIERLVRERMITPGEASEILSARQNKE